MSKVEEVTKHLKNINGAYEALRKIKDNIENCKNGDYSYQRCFTNITELANVALEYIRREL